MAKIQKTDDSMKWLQPTDKMAGTILLNIRGCFDESSRAFIVFTSYIYLQYLQFLRIITTAYPPFLRI